MAGMMVLLHGVAGGWDELAIAAVAIGVLWFAVKLAGRKPATEDDEESPTEAIQDEPDKDATDSAHPTPTKLG